MEFAASLDAFNCPTAPFMEPMDNAFIAACQAEYDERQHDKNASQYLWSTSTVNPLNRPESSLIEVRNPGWRVDGVVGLGRGFLALPIFLLPDLPVRHIDVILPCQSQYPASLRRNLRDAYEEAASNMPLDANPISRLLIRVLDRWSQIQPHFKEIYSNIPFGSKIVIENFTDDIEKVRVRFHLNNDLNKKLLSLETVRHQLKMILAPPVLTIGQLRLVARLNGNVSVVQIPSLHGQKQFVFKTNLRRPANTYRELCLLLSLKRSSGSIVSAPPYVVTADQNKFSACRILGFLLEYYPTGTLKDLLDSSASLKNVSKLKWALQIVQTMRYLHGSSMEFYSDLKPDNLIVCPVTQDIIFIDFEQGGNWDTFTAPEILYLVWMKRLIRLDVVPQKIRDRYQEMINNSNVCHMSKDLNTSDLDYFYNTWTALTRNQQEAAMVYSVGKVLWCIFEECSHTKNSTDENYDKIAQAEFPHFSRTPHELRKLIIECTQGAPELLCKEEVSIVRKGPFLLPRHDIQASPRDTMDAAKRLWAGRLREMEAYVAAKGRWVQGRRLDGDEIRLGFPLRHSLAEIEKILTNCTKHE